MVVDTANKKLLTVTSNYTNSDGIHFQGGLFRCELDGTNCTFRDFHGTEEYWQPSVLIDPWSGKLLISAMTHRPWPAPPGVGLFRCDLDGSSCTHTDIYKPTSSGLSTELDLANRKLLAITDQGVLSRCNLDGTGCEQRNVIGDFSTQDPKIVVDTKNAKLLVVFPNSGVKGASYDPSYPDRGKPMLARCELDGTACVIRDLSQGLAGSFMTYFPSAFIDDANAKLIVAAETTLLRCELDGSACVRTDTSFGDHPRLVTSGAFLDTVHSKILLLKGTDFVRCDRDARNCTRHPMPGYWLSYPSNALLPSGTIVSVGTDYQNAEARLGLALITTW
jgi:hypothetical protein